MAAFVNIKQHLICSICLETFKKPKTLPCLHSFCESCLDGHIRAYPNRLDNFFSCPLCGVDVYLDQSNAADQWTESFPTNHYIVSLIEDDSLQSQKYFLEQTDVPNCVPCKLDSKTIKAFCFCLDCAEYICKTCYEVHRKFKVTRNHTTLKGEELPKDVSALSRLSKIKFCTVHPEKEIEFKCNNDCVLICSICATTQHRKCAEIEHISIKNEIPENKSEHTLAKISSLKTNVEKTLQFRLRKMDCVEKEAKSTVKCSTEIIDHLKELLNHMEHRFIIQYQEHVDFEKKKVANSVVECFGLVEKLNKMIDLIKTSQNYGSDIQKTLVCSQVKDEEATINHYLAKQSAGSTKFLREFLRYETDAMKKTIQRDISDKIGNLCLTCTTPEQELQQANCSEDTMSDSCELSAANSMNEKAYLIGIPFIETARKQVRAKRSFFKRIVRKIGEHDLSVESTSLVCTHNGLLVMDNGNLIFIDSNNRLLKMANQSFKILCHKSFDETPLDICRQGDWRVAVATKHAIDIICVTKQTEFGPCRLFFHKDEVRSICPVGNGLAVLCITKEKKYYIEMRDNEHNITKNISKFISLGGHDVRLNQPNFIRSNDENELIVCEAKRIVAYTLGGSEKWYFAPGSFMQIQDVTFDSEGTMYICDVIKCNITQKVKGRFDRCRELVSTVQSPTSISFNAKHQTIIVGCQANNTVYAYKFI